MNARLCQHIALDKGELAAALTAIERFLEAADVPARPRHDLLLAADEVGANVAAHAYRDGDGPRWLLIDTEAGSGAVSMVFSDGGVAFDPRSLADADTDAALDDRVPGGLGILLVRRLMDGFDYARVDGCNRVSLVRRW